MKRSIIQTLSAALFASVFAPMAACPPAKAQQPRTNIVIIWGDDIGQSNISAYSRGMMGYQTPNIDRVANEGVMVTDYYAEQSCTAGRASFITGQSGLRTGMTKVGLPGATLGLQKEDPTIAELLKPLGLPPVSLARTISATATSFYRRYMVLMSSTAISTT
jgi:arylsulfatase